MSLLKTTFNMQSMLQSLNKSTQCCNYTTSIKQLITHYNKYTIQQHNTTQQQRLFATSNINPLLLHPRSEPTIDQQGYTYSILNNVFSPTKCISVSLRQIYGVGPSVALQLCGELGINPLSNPTDIGIQRFEYIKRILERRYQPRHIAEKQQQPYILRKIRLGLYSGLRHQLLLPVHGQRTHSNARTQRKLGRRRAGLFGYNVIHMKGVQANRLINQAKTLLNKAGKKK